MTRAPSRAATVAQLRPATPASARRGIIAAVVARAGNRAAGQVVQRWEAEEHLELGDVTGELIDLGDGVELSFGQIVALAGDEFGTEKALRDAIETTDGRAMIRAHLERAALPMPVRGSLPEPTEAQKDQAGTEYVTLAMDNSTHFVGGGTAVESWLDHHFRAVDAAMQAGLAGDRAMLNSAKLTEAFGAHFLTDAFSSGHIRVPRQDIIDHYVGDIAPAVYDHLVDYLREHLVDEIYDQVEQQTVVNEAAWIVGGVVGGIGVRKYMKRKIRNAINEMLDEAIATIGGRQQAVRMLGLGLAGLVSGAMHDAENVDGLWVISDVYPDPWEAFGDGRLDQNSTHRSRVEEAVRVSLADLQAAYDIGFEEFESLHNLPEPSWVPSRVYFEFGQFTLTPQTEAALEMVAHFMRYHTDTVVTLGGHADQIGKDPDNDLLSEARAEAAKGVLLGNGVEESRITVQFHGERAPVTTNPRRYELNRRVDISFATDAAAASAGQTPDDVAYAKALERVKGQVGPPYAAEGHFPRAAPGLNAPLPSWQWGSISGPLRTEMNAWAKNYIGQYKPKVAGAPALAAREVEGYTVDPRPIVTALLDRAEADAVAFLETALGRSAD
jgi:outer membrane protein OmpA-like peptidoglycan-associated protein